MRCLDADASKAMVAEIDQAHKDGDTLGGVVEVCVHGLPPGLGSHVHWDRRLDGLLAQAVLSIPAQKAVEIGDGFEAAGRPGSLVHDAIVKEKNGRGRETNRAGGVEGGVSNGMPVVVRGYMKPIPTLIRPLMTVDLATGEPQPTRYERSDVTSVPAASTVA